MRGEDCPPSRRLPSRFVIGEVFKDLRGVACPMNFVKTKVELARMGIGDVFYEILPR